MKIKLILIILYITIFYSKANDFFLTGYGKSFSEARNGASKVAMLQSMKIIGQNYYKTKNGDWVVTLKVRYFYEN